MLLSRLAPRRSLTHCALRRLCRRANPRTPCVFYLPRLEAWALCKAQVAAADTPPASWGCETPAAGAAREGPAAAVAAEGGDKEAQDGRRQQAQHGRPHLAPTFSSSGEHKAGVLPCRFALTVCVRKEINFAVQTLPCAVLLRINSSTCTIRCCLLSTDNTLCVYWIALGTHILPPLRPCFPLCFAAKSPAALSSAQRQSRSFPVSPSPFGCVAAGCMAVACLCVCEHVVRFEPETRCYVGRHHLLACHAM